MIITKWFKNADGRLAIRTSESEEGTPPSPPFGPGWTEIAGTEYVTLFDANAALVAAEREDREEEERAKLAAAHAALLALGLSDENASTISGYEGGDN